MLFSSGWDRQVLQWNIERKCVVRHFSGPFVCGEGLDVDPGGELLLTASHRETQCIELWKIAGAAPKKVREVAPSEAGWHMLVSSTPELQRTRVSQARCDINSGWWT